MACSRKNTAVKSLKAEVKTDSIKVDTLKVVNPTDNLTDRLFNEMDQNSFRFETLAMKASIDAKTAKINTGFTANIRMRHDSAIWVSVSPALGIEVMRVLLTKDSVKFVDRINKKYYVGDYQFINKALETEIDFELIESLLTGNNFLFYDYDKFRLAGYKDSIYEISTFRKRKLKKSLKNQNPDSVKVIQQNVMLRDRTFKITGMVMNDIKSNKRLEANYLNFNTVAGQLFSHQIVVNIKADKQAIITLDYAKIEPEKLLSFPFSVPDKYEKIN